MFYEDGYDLSQKEKFARLNKARDMAKAVCEEVGWERALSALMSVIIAEGIEDAATDALAVGIGKAVSRFEAETGQTLDGYGLSRYHGRE